MGMKANYGMGNLGEIVLPSLEIPTSGTSAWLFWGGIGALLFLIFAGRPAEKKVKRYRSSKRSYETDLKAAEERLEAVKARKPSLFT